MRTVLLLFCTTLACAQIGIFDNHGDVGVVLTKGSAAFDSAKTSYKVTGSGDNVWGTADGFHYVWKRVSGDMTLSADISFATSTGEAHKKAMLMIRQSLDADSAYADATVHVNGLTSLQSRDEKGAGTHEVQWGSVAPKHVSIRRIGN